MVRNSPQRSCIGCRQARDKGDLLRFVLTPERTLVPDIQAKLPGRGAYTCFNKRCLDEAVRKNQFSRTFKGAVSHGTAAELVDEVSARLLERVSSYIALANKAGKVITGSDMVEESIRKQKAGLVIIAQDVSSEIGEKIARLAERTSIPCYYILTKDQLGALVGKGLRSAVAIGSGGFVHAITNEIERMRNFFEEGAHE